MINVIHHIYSDIYNDVSFSRPNARASRERDSIELNIEPESGK